MEESKSAGKSPKAKVPKAGEGKGRAAGKAKTPGAAGTAATAAKKTRKKAPEEAAEPQAVSAQGAAPPPAVSAQVAAPPLPRAAHSSVAVPQAPPAGSAPLPEAATPSPGAPAAPSPEAGIGLSAESTLDAPLVAPLDTPLEAPAVSPFETPLPTPSAAAAPAVSPAEFEVPAYVPFPPKSEAPARPVAEKKADIYPFPLPGAAPPPQPAKPQPPVRPLFIDKEPLADTAALAAKVPFPEAFSESLPAAKMPADIPPAPGRAAPSPPAGDETEPPRADEQAPALEDEDASRIRVELEQLQDLIKDLPFLEYLRARLDRIIEGQKRFRDLVGFYRLISRGLKDEYDKVKAQVRLLEGDVQELKSRAVEAKPEPKEPEPPLIAGGELMLRKILDAKEALLMEYMERLEAMKEDVQNIKSRMKGELDMNIERANQELLKKLLPTIDNFDRAVQASRGVTNVDAVLSGFTMIQRAFEEVLDKEGLVVIKAMGEPFDPKIHEALMEVETNEVPEDTVYEEITRGFYLKGKVLRPTMVKVARAPRS